MTFPTSSPALAKALDERGYKDPTPVQTAVLAPDAEGRDLIVSAQTGSGKTVAYGLALAKTLLGEAETMDVAGAPLALIVAPTRELALQVQRELAWLYLHLGARVIACVGGMEPRRERRQLADGAHIVVGTPGRLRDHIQRRALDLSQLRAVVLDEADEMLDLGFRDDLEFILETTPATRRTLMFSATLPKAIIALARRYQRDALRIETVGGSNGHVDIAYRAIRVMRNEVEHAVVNLLRFIDAPSAIIFCNTRESVRHLHAMLLERGFSAVLLSGELSQNERNHALQAMRDGRARVCIATDVAARGLDLPNLGLVVHADLPTDPEVLQHRSGRTGRAGRKGISVLLVPPSARHRAERLLAAAGIDPAWSGPPTFEEIVKLDQERLLQDPLFSEELGEDDLAMGNALLAERSAETIAALLVRLYRSRLPVPEEVSDPGPGSPARRPLSDDGRAGPGKKPAGANRHSTGDGVWFRLDIGRRKNADPRWLLPMLCRRGKITREDIGAIRIFENETKIEIAASAAAGFAANALQAKGDDARIERLGAMSSKGPAWNPGDAKADPAKRVKERWRKAKT